MTPSWLGRSIGLTLYGYRAIYYHLWSDGAPRLRAHRLSSGYYISSSSDDNLEIQTANPGEAQPSFAVGTYEGYR